MHGLPISFRASTLSDSNSFGSIKWSMADCISRSVMELNFARNTVCCTRKVEQKKGNEERELTSRGSNEMRKTLDTESSISKHIFSPSLSQSNHRTKYRHPLASVWRCLCNLRFGVASFLMISASNNCLELDYQ